MPVVNTFLKDQAVNVKFSTITGVVTGAFMDDDLAIHYWVAYTSPQTGEPQLRAFDFDQLEAA